MHITERVVPPNPSFPYPGCVFQTSPDNIFLISWWVAISTKGHTTIWSLSFLPGKDPYVLYSRYDRPLIPVTMVLIMLKVIFFGMTIWKFLGTAKTRGRLSPRYEFHRSFSPLLMAFVRDGTVYFFLYVVILYDGLSWLLSVSKNCRSDYS